jgi:hypothetical protein
MVLVLPTHVFGKGIIETSKIHNLFMQYPNIHNFVHWNILENGDKIHKFLSF